MIKVKTYIEFNTLLLSHCAGLKILKPDWLREKIMEEARGMLGI